MTTVGAALGALAIMSAGLAPAAVADDIQSQQWYLDAMNAQGLWKVSTGKGISVAVIDSGVNLDTNALKGQVLPGVDVTGSAGDETDDYTGHGTSMAELIAGTGKGGSLQGVAPGAKIIPIRTRLNGLKDEEATRKGDTVAKAIRAAADSDAKIISMSLTTDYPIDGGLEAVQYAQSKGKLLIAGVGNDAEDGNYIGYPAKYPGVVAVSAIDETGEVAKFSEHGNYVDLAAPGVDVPTWCDNSFKSYCAKSRGTSQATAITAGAAALIWAAHPKWTANQVLRVLIDTAGRDWPKNTPSRYLGYGTIRPAQVLLKGRGNPGPADIDPLTNKKTPGVSANAGGASPSTSASDSSQASKTTSGGRTSAAGSSAESSGNTTLWVALGAAAAVVVVGGGAFAVMRSRRGV
ncbi:S8 family serine peptidase [Streptomyces sp. NPDC005202]|uniref:S8 family serine peptidase n=1 Tax=Streptomyces sp. NPDC005202 TaxID=3157021 RepID=UPI0033B2163A